MVSLIGIGHIGAIVQVVLMAILIDVLVIVTLISNQVIVYISLLDKYKDVNRFLYLHLLECVIIHSVVQYLVRIVQ